MIFFFAIAIYSVTFKHRSSHVESLLGDGDLQACLSEPSFC